MHELNAFVHRDPAPSAGDGILAGWTVGIKDTQPVAGMPWTYGSRRWRDRIADFDAPAVARLRSAGAAILGKTNTPELAAAIGTVNELFGPTHNPWRQGYTPGGSSGGSGAAVAGGECRAALGDDMGGSIRIPASCCGVVGIRPSPGTVPNWHPDPTGLSVAGPIATSVADARAVLGVITGSVPPPALRRPVLRIAVVVDSPFGIDAEPRAAVRRAADALRAMGHRLVDLDWDPAPAARAYQVVRPASVAGMPGAVDGYGAAVQGLIRRGREISAAEFLAALAAGRQSVEPVRLALRERRLDGVLTPTLGLAPMPIADVPAFLGDAWLRYTQFVLPVSFAGLPAVSVPAGLGEAGGLPVGVQLVGAPGGEWALLDLAAELEAAPGFGFRPPA